MLEIEECIARLLAEVGPKTHTRTVPLAESRGMILGRDVRAERMVPPYPKSAMDGYAVRAADIAGATGEHPAVLRVAGELLAGDYEEIPYRERTAVRVMTGSYIPGGFDAVVRQEDTDCGEEKVAIYAPVSSGTNYCEVGEDIKKGELVFPGGTRLSPVGIGLLASLGIGEVCVLEPAKIAIISTGTELAEVGEELAPGKIYNSIAHMLAAEIRSEGLEVCGMRTCADEGELLRSEIEAALGRADMIITTGAVSVGKKDIVPGVLEEMGARTLFRGANIQPGTPTMASVLGDRVILSLSGNPYAAIVNFEIYFWPAMSKMMCSSSFEGREENAVLASEYRKVNRLRRMIRARAQGGKVTIPSKVHSSSVIYNLMECNCYIDLEAGRAVQPGDTVRIRYLRGQ